MTDAATLKEYVTQVDAEKCVVIRGVDYDFYSVFHRKDGTILLKPRKLPAIEPISADTLRTIAESVAGMKAGKRSKPVDLKKLAADEPLSAKGSVEPFSIEMGAPEVAKLWEDLLEKYAAGMLNADERELLRKLQKTFPILSRNPFHPGMNTHPIDDLTRRFGQKVWQSYLENNKPGARRIFWSFGPEKGVITILGIEKHPESGKSRAYARVKLSEMRKPEKSGGKKGQSAPERPKRRH